MGRGPLWRDEERWQLIDMRVRDRCRWGVIATALGRTIASCKGEFFQGKIPELRRARRAGLIAAAREVTDRLEAARGKLPSLPPSPVNGRSTGRAVSHHVLRADVELRGRIAILGLTGGLLGDPAPGRSALDARAGGDDAESEHRIKHNRRAPPITLATGPQR